MKELVGKTINKVRLSADKQRISFDTIEGDVVYRCDGDCCSSTWIEHVYGLKALIDRKVTGYQVSDEVVDGSDDRDELVQVYRERVSTDCGWFEVEFRNGSNGYYGVSLDVVDDVDVSADPPLTDDF